jgi:hypothetical protein
VHSELSSNITGTNGTITVFYFQGGALFTTERMISIDLQIANIYLLLGPTASDEIQIFLIFFKAGIYGDKITTYFLILFISIFIIIIFSFIFSFIIIIFFLLRRFVFFPLLCDTSSLILRS